MKKVTAIIALLLLVMLTACTAEPASAKLVPSPYPEVQQSKKIKMTIREDQITAEDETIHLLLENLSDRSCTFGEELHLERRTDDGWMAMKEDNPALAEEDYQMSPGGTWDQTLSLGDHYGTLHPGSYRIVKEIWQNTGTVGADAGAKKERILVQAEFQVI